MARAGIDDIARHGIVAARCRSIVALAQAQESGAVCLDGRGHQTPEEAIARPADLPGIGPWTANYMAMRALRWPDSCCVPKCVGHIFIWESNR